ncbi:MAG: HIT domain-containing protein [Ignavibacteriaceae bacterium]
MFELHPELKENSFLVGNFPLSLLLLNNDSNYPWFILVPKKENIREIFELSEKEQIQLLKESSYLAAGLQKNYRAHKINIAALGNAVPQLHVHHIVRYKNDAAWPHPVWGKVTAKPYSNDLKDFAIEKLKGFLKVDFLFII